MDGLVGVRRRFAALEKVLDERSRRLVVAAECKAWGPGGISAVSQATGISRPVIRQGLKELEQPPAHPDGRIRRPGVGGRRSSKRTRRWLWIWRSWWSPRRGVIRNAVCGGPARVCASWPKNWGRWDM